MLNYPSVSIVIPAYNAQDTIIKCLHSIRFLDYPPEKLEVIIIDNGSTDNTVQIVKKLGFNIVSFPNGSIGAVRNFGASFARGEVIAHTDSDCVLPAQWLISAIRAMQTDKAIGAVGGGCLVPNDATLLEKAWVTQQKDNLQEVKYLPACNFILLKAFFDSLSGFNEEITAGEDDDLSIKISETGRKIVSIKDCYILHLGYPKTYYKIFKRQIWHGRSALDLSNKTSSMLWATLFFTAGIVSSLFLLQFFTIKSNILWFSIITLIFFMPGLMTYKKIHGREAGILNWLMLPTIFMVFFTGRAVGLLLALFDRLVGLY